MVDLGFMDFDIGKIFSTVVDVLFSIVITIFKKINSFPPYVKVIAVSIILLVSIVILVGIIRHKDNWRSYCH